jgi:hypothetical protein
VASEGVVGVEFCEYRLVFVFDVLPFQIAFLYLGLHDFFEKLLLLNGFLE